VQKYVNSSYLRREENVINTMQLFHFTMRYQKTFVAFSALCALLFSSPAIAHSVIEKVVETGVLTVGTSKDAFPFAYKDKNGRLTGYSIDMLLLIQKQLEKQLKRPIKMELFALAPADRIPKLKSGAVDIVCDAASFTWERNRDVDFTVSYATTGTQLMARKRAKTWDIPSLAGQKIGAMPGTTSEEAVRQAQPQAQVVLVKDRAEGYKLLQENKITAFADDRILLEAWLPRIPNAQNFQILNTPLSKEGIACMVPENNSTFLDVANYSLVRFMQGFIKGKPSYVQTFDRWFGAQSVLPLSRDLRELVIDNMRLVIDTKQEIPDNEL
jgi:polar amino acid transport system substrate-binding protein